MSEVRLIDANALKKAITETTYNFEQIPIRVDKVQEIIDNAPTVNLEKQSFIDGFKEGCEHGKKCYERPQGEWVEQRDSLGCLQLYCNQCGAKAQVGFVSFCGKCGADMRKGGEEE